MTFPFRSRLQTIEQIAFRQPHLDLFELGYVAPFATELPTEADPAEPPADASADADAPPVVAPPTRDVRGEIRKLFTPIFEALASLDVGDDLALKERCATSRQELSQVSQSLADLFAEAREQKIVHLTTEHSAAADACRAQREVVKAAEQRVNEHQGEIRKANTALSQARAKFNTVLEREPSADTWPTAVEKHRWTLQRDAARAALTTADEAQGNCFERDRELRRSLAAAREKLDELAKAEAVLRNRLSGRPWHDAEFGLTNPPEL